MNFKYGKFDIATEVVREFEKKAIANGESLSTVEEAAEKIALTKKASNKSNLSPGEDLFEDLMKLASGLRSRGFIEQADDLEANIINYKTAEVHLYRVHDTDAKDLIDFAHPDGDVAVADPVKDDHHMVETIFSQQKKILDVVNKNPTGKYASKVDLILKKAYNILIKNAQEASNLSDKLSLLNEEIETAWVTMKSDINKITSMINLNEVYENNFPVYGFSEYWIMASDENTKFYSEQTGINYNSLIRYKNIINKLYSNNIRNYTYNEWKELSNSISPAVSQKYFTGTQPGFGKKLSTLKFDNEIGIDNTNSIWVIPVGNLLKLSIDNNKLKEAIGVLHQEVLKIKNNILGDELLKKINDEKVYPKINKIIEGIKQYIPTLDNVPEITFNQASIRDFISKSANIHHYFSSLLNDKNRNAKEFYSVLSWFKGSEFVDTIKQLIQNISNTSLSISQNVSANAFGAAGEIIQPDVSANLAARLVAISNAWYQFAQAHSNNEELQALGFRNASNADNFAKYIQNSSGKPFGFLYSVIKDNFPNITNIKLIEQEVSSWESATNEYTGYLSNVKEERVKSSNISNKSILKKANVTKLELPPANLKIAPSTNQTNQSPQAQQSHTSTTTQKQQQTNRKRPSNTRRISNKEKQAVITMQDMLQHLSEHISKGFFTDKNGERVSIIGKDLDDAARTKLLQKIRTTGARVGSNRSDGLWGQNTANALRAANELFRYISSFKSKVTEGPMMGQGDKAIDAAEKNSQIILSFMRAADVDKEVPSSLVSKIDNKSKDSKGIVYDILNGGIAVYDWNVNSLSNFHNFILANDDSINSINIETDKFSQWLWFLSNRAMAEIKKMNTLDENTARVKHAYFNAMNRLISQFNKMITMYSRNGATPQYLTKDMLDSFSPKSQKNEYVNVENTKGERGNYTQVRNEDHVISSDDNRISNDPFGKIIRLDELARLANKSIQDFPQLSYGRSLILDLTEFNNKAMASLASEMIISHENQTESNISLFRRYLKELKRLIDEAWFNFYYSNVNDFDRQMLAAHNKKRSNWINAISRLERQPVDKNTLRRQWWS